MKKTISGAAFSLLAALKSKGAQAFSNVAEGRSAGNKSMKASSAIGAKHLLAAFDSSSTPRGFVTAGAAGALIGVCTDEGGSSDYLNVNLGGSTPTTLLCRTAGAVTAGRSLYSAAGGRVTQTAAAGARKVGTALQSATSGELVEIDPAGFNTSPYGVYACGIHTWSVDSSTTDALSVTGIADTDMVFVNLQAAGGSAKCASAAVTGKNMTITLDAAGVKNSTKVSWMILRAI